MENLLYLSILVIAVAVSSLFVIPFILIAIYLIKELWIKVKRKD